MLELLFNGELDLKKICFITTISVTLKAFVVDSAKYLYENGGYNITFICDNDTDFAEGLPDYFNYIPVPMKRGISLSGIGAIFKLLIIFRNEKFDMVQYSTPNASFYASIAGKLAGVPVRLYCQWGILYVSFSGLKKRLFKAIEKLVCRLSTWIEPDSYGNLNFSWSERLYNDKKSSVVWNGSASGVDLNKFNIAYKEEWRKKIRSKYDITEDTFVLGFVGRITRDKGINELYSACRMYFKEQTKSILMLIGDMEISETINNELYQWSIGEKRIIYCGRTNEVEKFLSAMDVFVLPSYREGFGTVVIEAQAMGVPVIVTNIPGPTEAMIPDVTGLVVNKCDDKSLFVAINKTQFDRETFSTMSKKAVIFVKDNFDRDILFERILQDRERLVKEVKKTSDSSYTKGVCD